MARRRSKPRLFSFPREVELAHYGSLPAHVRDMLEQMVDGFIEVCEHQRLSPLVLDVFRRATTFDHPTVRKLGFLRLSVLSHYFPQAGDVVQGHLRHEDQDVKILATVSLANMPAPVANRGLTIALSDPDQVIRLTAAEASKIRRVGAGQVLRDAIVVESDPVVLKALHAALAMQVD